MSCRFLTIIIRQKVFWKVLTLKLLTAQSGLCATCKIRARYHTSVHRLLIEEAPHIVSCKLLIVLVNPFRYSFQVHLLLVTEHSNHAKVKYLWATSTTIAESWYISPIVSARFANLHNLQWHLLNVFITNPIFVHATNLHEWFTLYNCCKYYEEVQY